jgi:hypothetical protein
MRYKPIKYRHLLWLLLPFLKVACLLVSCFSLLIATIFMQLEQPSFSHVRYNNSRVLYTLVFVS